MRCSKPHRRRRNKCRRLAVKRRLRDHVLWLSSPCETIAERSLMLTVPTSSAFDDFLFAVIREETNGTPLSVISALSRLGLEPWQEAGRLPALPAAAAAAALTALLGRLPQGAAASESADRSHLVAGLIELLP